MPPPKITRKPAPAPAAAPVERTMPAPAVPLGAASPPAPQPPPFTNPLPPLEPPLPDGMRLGAFEIKGVISQSRAAVVYLASDHSLGIPAAIKEYMPAGVARRGATHHVEAVEPWHEDAVDLGRRAFFAEARALARCDNDALLRVTQLWEVNGTAYRVMPLYSGKRLVDLRREMRGPVDETWLRALTDRLLDALAAYHASAGAHGNVTPANILMPSLDRPVLLGPGKASLMLATELGGRVRTEFETAFAAPEQLAPAGAAPLGIWTDLYGLAQTLRFCITGNKPHPEESARRAIHRALGAGVVSSYSDQLLDALSLATAESPQDRPKSLDEFRVRLRRAENEAALPPPAVIPTLMPTRATPPPAAAAHAAPAAQPQPPVAAPSAHASETRAREQPDIMLDDSGFDEANSETIDVSSLFGDLVGEPVDSTPPSQTPDEPRRPAAAAPPPRVDPVMDADATIPQPKLRHDPAIAAAHSQRAEFGGKPQAMPEVTAQVAAQVAAQVFAQAAALEPPRAAPHATPSRPAPWHDAPTAPARRGGTPSRPTPIYGDYEHAASTAGSDASRSIWTPPVRNGLFAAITVLATFVLFRFSDFWEVESGVVAAPPAAEVATQPSQFEGRALGIPGSSGAIGPSGRLPADPIGTLPGDPATLPPIGSTLPSVPSAGTRDPIGLPPDAASADRTADKALDRAGSVSRSRSAAPPPVETSTSPRDACTGKTQFALYRCMQAQCGTSRWAAHPECVRLRKIDDAG